MAFGNNAIRVFFLLMVVCVACAKKAAEKESAAPAEGASAASGPGGSFDITKLGATGDGKTDCTKAVQEAWTSACGGTGKQTILIPKGDYLVGPLNFTGPCKGDITIQVDGNLLASTDLSQYKGNWIEILRVDNIVITGAGKLDGQGPTVWSKNACAKKYDCKILPNTLVLDFVNNGLISGITLLNAKFFHMNVFQCKDLTIKDVTITAPEDSPNTDGIHIGDSSKITITGTTIGTGDDCISIGPGSAGINITGVTCGPGHGISVGSLGRYKDEKDVTDITVKDCVLKKTTNGVLQIDPFSTSFSGHETQMAARKNQAVNANYLLNFHYDPISRPQPRGPRTYPPRRQRKIKPYNKDLFLQANFKFVVLDTGNCQIESMDPDKMLQWEDVICVRYCSPSEVQCPICLESPLCPQITSCGHIYCFPCILRYLLMGKEDYRGECWKKCPLCFMMISTKELYTIYISQVQHFRVGDNATFTLLSRSKNSLAPFVKNLSSECTSVDEDPCNVFSKFVFTSDVELSVREAKSDLSNWLHRADIGLVDDLEKLPYVSAALEQLEERMKYWTEFRNYSSSPPLKDSFSPVSSFKSRNSDNAQTSCQNSGHRLPPVSDGDMITGVSEISISPESNKRMSSKMEERCAGPIDSNEQDSYTFYQVSDGQHLILHPLNMKCLLNHYGRPDMLPPRITGKILGLETVTQSEATRKRYRFLSHFSLTTTFQFCEIDLSNVLPPISLAPFMDEIKKREKQRMRTAKKEESERVKAEVAAAVQASAMRFEHANFSHSHSDVMFSLDDFEALGNSAGPSMSPPANERKLFSDVTRLGFASAQDSPPLRVETGDATGKNESTRDQGSAATSALSFASILSSTRAADNSVETHKPNGVGKKGKKPTKVLLSTGGGRRY